MGRTFCKTLYALVQRNIKREKKTHCIEEGCKGYISRVPQEDPIAYCEYIEFTERYKCDGKIPHEWLVIKNNLDDSLQIVKL